ncbi:F-box protein PP2-B10-like [Olea europaea var. sylvestris]|uniref:F-box protein PP2-B10-like n=1 Tax=Olea europaea var. sylvestris TaxID=158386 RepID=UPI000C1CDD96|nr:F-box protein PP2-B10-like [Olea europaea var. sylvestris]
MCYDWSKKLKILWGEIPEFWKLASHPDSKSLTIYKIYLFSFEFPLKLHVNNIMCRFSTVAKLKQVLRFDIRGQIDTNMLSPETPYAAYLVYGFANSYKGGPLLANAIISFDRIKDGDAQKRASVFNLNPRTDRNGNTAMRLDKWMEVEIGSFYTDQENNSCGGAMSPPDLSSFSPSPNFFGVGLKLQCLTIYPYLDCKTQVTSIVKPPPSS